MLRKAERDEDRLSILGDDCARLVSLWEVLKKFAESFYQLGAVIATYRLQFNPEKPPIAFADLDIKTKTAYTFSTFSLNPLNQRLNELELTFSLKAVRKLEELLNQGSTPLGEPKLWQLANAMESIDEHIRHELQERVLFYVSPGKATCYDNFRDGWEDALNKFDIAADVEEAEKCYALDRFAASVFHAMRVTEAGVVALGAHFSLPPNILETPWGNIIHEIEGVVKNLPQTTPSEKEIQSKFAAIAADLFQVNLAWRIPASHVTRKPASKYTSDEAADVLSRTKALMRHLADVL